MGTEDLDRLTRIRARLAGILPTDVEDPFSDLHYCVGEIRRLEGVRARLENKQNQVRHALYDHAGEHRVGERESRDALEIRALRAQRDILMVAVRNECVKFASPDEDRPGLHEALLEAEKIRWQDRGFEVPCIPSSEEEQAEIDAMCLEILRADLAIEQPALKSIPVPAILAVDPTPGLAEYTRSKHLDVLPEDLEDK